jgi:hypothetical protein
MIKSMSITIKGSSPVLMHRFPLEEIVAIDKKTPAEQAEIAAYRNPETQELYMPSVNLQRSLVRAANYSKGKGRATLAKPAAACLLVTPERIGLGTKHFDIDSRAVVIAATRGRIVRHRPRLDSWQLTFTVEYDDSLLKETEVRCIIDNAGLRVGIGDFRPEKGGSFGRFVVVNQE